MFRKAWGGGRRCSGSRSAVWFREQDRPLLFEENLYSTGTQTQTQTQTRTQAQAQAQTQTQTQFARGIHRTGMLCYDMAW